MGATTETGVACPTNNASSGALCEFSDALCLSAGACTISVNGTPQTVSWPVAGCQDNTFQNGDLDFDGSPYVADWPDGSATHPTSISYIGPFTGSNSNTYPQIQFETDLGGSEILCDTATGAGCTVPPLGPGGLTFYPFWTLAHSPAGCVWNFGNVIPGQTVQNFGGPAEYGTPDVARFGGTFTSQVISNPQLGSCGFSARSRHG